MTKHSLTQPAADGLLERLARLRINSPDPSPLSSPSGAAEFILESIQVDSPSLLKRLSVLMNPHAMTQMGLERNSLVKIQDFLFPVAPDVKCPKGTIRLDRFVLGRLARKDGDRVAPSTVVEPLRKLVRMLVLVESHPSASERALLISEMRQLPVINENFPYEVMLGPNKSTISCKALGDLGGAAGSPFGYICEETAIEVVSKDSEVNAQTLVAGRLKEQSKFVTEVISLALFQTEELQKRGIRAPRGILLYGPPGTGKTLLARYIAQTMRVKMLSLEASQVLGKFYGETERLIQEIFSEACNSGPALIFIDEFDSLCSQRDSSSSGADQRIVASLLCNIENISDRPVFILAATNSINSVDTAFRRPGRFDYEVEIGIPGVDCRRKILEALLDVLGVTSDEIDKIANATHGFVGADLELLVREACLHSITRTSDHAPPRLTNKDLKVALTKVKPSAMRELLLEVPRVSWNDIGGQDAVKQLLRESIQWPLQKPEKFKLFNIEPPKGVLLFGPPGCSKTLLAKALASESGLNFIAIKGPELFSKWVGDSEKIIKEVFRKARLVSPSIIFFDEFDAIASKRSEKESSVTERVISQILAELDGAEPLSRVIVIAATNRPDVIDPAMLRPGRFDRHIYIPLPDLKTRFEIFRIHTSRMPLHEDVDLSRLSTMTEGYSGAEIQALCQEAAMSALRQSKDAALVSYSDFEGAVKSISPRTPLHLLETYRHFSGHNMP